MNDYTSVVDALDRLTEAVSANASSFFSELLTAFLAMVGSVAAVLIFEVIKSKVFSPREEFRRLRRKVNSTLSLYACYYTNQIDLARAGEREKENYSSASKSVREMAVELMAFADEVRGKKCCGVKVDDISEAAAMLMVLSNMFFTPYNCPEMADNRGNDHVRKVIRERLKIDHKWK